MKKIYQLWVGLCLLPLSLSAQYAQGFDSATLPSDWTIINGGDPDTWKTWSSYDNIFNGPRSGSHFLGLYFDPDFDVPHDDYAISPAISITAGTSNKLTFWAKNRGFSDLDSFDVKISTTTPTIAAFTNTLAASITPPSSVWTRYTYDLSPYVGQTVYIAFHSKSNKWFIGIDDFEVSANTNLNVSETNLDKAAIYPNPVQDILNIKNKNKISEISIFDITGKLQKKESVNSRDRKSVV